MTQGTRTVIGRGKVRIQKPICPFPHKMVMVARHIVAREKKNTRDFFPLQDRLNMTLKGL